MKVFEYSYYIPYGSGCGIVFAESQEEALKIISEHPYDKLEELTIVEVDATKPLLIDFSWSE